MAENRLVRELESSEQVLKRPEAWKPPELLPEVRKQPGFAYRWIRTSMLGQSDARNVSSKLREGWEPVKLADQPEMQFFVDAESKFKDCIEIGGLLLCKTPQEFVEQRNTYYAAQAQAQTDAVDNSLMKENDARMPLFKERKSTTSFGSGKS
ncbi:MAG: hypothetical protein EBR82_32235 [Caulobacteraceae bacterium]|nr:hypothetical protein [Caulobacteraceae bacterium]